MHDSETVPAHLASTYGTRVIRLDLSENCIRLFLLVLLDIPAMQFADKPTCESLDWFNLQTGRFTV